MIGSIYKITNKLNNKAYIGMTFRDPETRWWEHCNSAKKGSQYFIHQAINKHGPEHFEFSVLVQTKDEEALKDLEILMILEHGTHMSLQKGYNKTWGGDGATFSKKHGAKDPLTGKSLGLVHCDDPRWETGEIVSCRLGTKKSFSKSHSEYAKTRIGNKNANAKRYLLVSPDGEEHFIHGNCEQYVTGLGLKYSALYDYIGKGMVPPPSKFSVSRTTERRLKTVGWSLNKLE